jgi:hypothetical protein
MYNNREPRFYASVGFSGAFWPNRSATNPSEQRDVQVTYYASSPNGKFGPSNPDDHPMTGYVVKKYISNTDAWAGDNVMRLPKAFPIIRYAEILLAYAEALNQLGGHSFTVEVNGVEETFFRETEEIKAAFNLVRYRAGLPGLTNLSDPIGVMEEIKRERMVEFLYENRRYFDVRRWGDYDVSESEPIMGMNTSGNRDTYYQRVVLPSGRIAQRVVDRKMIFLPISTIELKRLPAFDQNPGW